MSKHPFCVFDSDGHVDEDQDEIAACFEGAYANPRWTNISGIFPKRRVAFLEAGCGWLPFMMDRMDYEYRSVHGAEVKPKLRRQPSEYFTETGNIWVSTELDERSLKYTIDAIGSTRLLYASDYGHEAPLAHIAAELSEFIADPAHGEEAKANILCRNGKELYRLP